MAESVDMPSAPGAVAQVFTAETLGVLAAVKRPAAHPADHQAEPIRTGEALHHVS
jgi:hypothetical protein